MQSRSRWWHRIRYLRAFRQWLKANRDLLGVRLIRTQSSKRSIEYRLAGYGGRLLLVVSAREIVVAAMREGDTWDLLFSSELVVKRRTSQGVVCTWCEPASRAFPCIDALWLAHDFEPLRVWLDRHFSDGPDVEFHCVDGATWVRIARGSGGRGAAGHCETLVELLPFHHPEHVRGS